MRDNSEEGELDPSVDALQEFFFRILMHMYITYEGAGPIGPWVFPHDIVDLRFRCPGANNLAVLRIFRYGS